MTTTLVAPSARLAQGWADASRIVVDGASIASVTAGADAGPDAIRLPGPVIPAIPNLHSHAFQRSIIGCSQRAHIRFKRVWHQGQKMKSPSARCLQTSCVRC